MNILSYWLLLTIFCCACSFSEDVVKVEEQFQESGDSREGKQLRESAEQGGWKVVDHNNWHNSQEWVPTDNSQQFSSDVSQKQFPRRRRIRKRKRRPPQFINSDESQEYPLRRRRIRPQTLLEDVNDSWAEIENESPRQPYHRRRTTPVYAPEIQTEQIAPMSAVLHFEESLEDKIEPMRVYEKVRDPYTALAEVETKARLKKKQQEEINEQETTTVSNLKTLLKQSGGSLSLSEILQQKNLSLTDLLEGKHHAILALTEKAETTTETHVVTEYKEEIELDFTQPPKFIELSTEKPKFVEDKSVIPTTNRIYVIAEGSYEIPPQNDTIPHYKQETKRLDEIKHHYEVVTEPTTERRIFVPSHPKYYSSFNYKSNMINKTAETIIKQTTKLFVAVEKFETTKPTPSTRKTNLGNKYLDYRSKYVSSIPKLRSTLPLTSAKLNRLTSKQPESNEEIIITTEIPSNAIKIDIKDLFGISNIVQEPQTVAPKEDGPVKMIIDIENLMHKVETNKENDHFTIDLINKMEDAENEVTTEKKNTETTTNYHEKIKPTSAREEIMEILRDHVSRQNLSRILELRNMTIEELVAQRERGSSQLHLADIFHNQTREPEPPSEPHIGHINQDFVERKAKAVPNPIEIKKDSQGSKYFTSVIDLEPLQLNSDKPSESSKKSEPPLPAYTVTSFPTYKIEMEKILKQNQPPPFQASIWKNLYPDLYTENTENSDQNVELDALKGTKVQDILQNEIRRVEDVENSISEPINGQLNIDLTGNSYEDDDHYFQLPRGVKSAIIASAAIIGISVLVFLTVFIIFKWLQKQKKRMSYSNSFSCSRIKSPILETRPKRTIRTIMSETLGRKKKYSNVYPQSMADYIWESDKKPFQ